MGAVQHSSGVYQDSGVVASRCVWVWVCGCVGVHVGVCVLCVCVVSICFPGSLCV